jgi:heterodisulfide reductase subunit A
MKNTILIIGAGLGGIEVALDAVKSEPNADAILVDCSPIIGGNMGSWLAEGQSERGNGRHNQLPRPEDMVLAHEGIEVLTQAEVIELTGKAGALKAVINQRARYVTNDCTVCNKCRSVCPVVVSNEFEAGLTYRKAIFSPVKNAVPSTYVVDIENCLNEPPNYIPCNHCVEVCDDNAILFDMPASRRIERDIQAVILSVGYELSPTTVDPDWGYGSHADILSLKELDRLLMPSGPTGGYLEKPSNEECPENLIIVLCDDSPIALRYVSRHVACLMEQDVDDITILYEPYTIGEGSEQKLRDAIPDANVKFVSGTVDRIHKNSYNTLRVRYEDAERGHHTTQEYDMVVLATAIRPHSSLPRLAKVLDIELDEDGYVKLVQSNGGLIGTTRPGVGVAGWATSLKDTPETVTSDKTAAAYALQFVEREPVARKALPEAIGEGILVKETWIPEEEVYRRLEGFVRSVITLGNKGKSS